MFYMVLEYQKMLKLFLNSENTEGSPFKKSDL